ncbi:hypothetical protein A2W14_03630 [Candidatus Gottesmanbacteria bacterium RBG_16_37_8]|uniref:Chlor_Arch_YYY domain-containing protein n=1 Tax=Candidatus Gottesmanbacteria bacterium RBG_16_37_8 TaxID=1798371 RepID=A0A1F5YSV9_9BACT|nr:MAG: hypothetical protein A2W14_03630 [Candidatus Gottesmanbacteria bacterium RBG_16_37_8]
MSDFSSIFIWWLTILIVSLCVLPLTLNIFRKFIDRGYIFSKILGIFISSYLIWLFGSLHILPFTKISVILVLILLSIINFIFIGRINKQKNVTFPWKWAVLSEILFFASLWFWSFVRANEPSIRGLEKFMDYGFVNSILKSTFFPPLDMWLSKSPDYTGGHFINYYYFGHYYTAFLTKLSGISSNITYNLMLATLFAFTFTLSFSIGVNLFHFFLSFKELAYKIHSSQLITRNLKLILAGLLTAFLVALAGNLHTVYTFTTGYPNESPKPFWQLGFGFHPERYWYPNATRFIPNTIHEFPIYSFVVADLHGHVADIPFVLLTIALLLNLIVNTLTPQKQEKEKRVNQSSFISSIINDYADNNPIPLSQIILLGALVAVMYMTNAWDGLIYLVLIGLVFLYLCYKTRKPEDSVFAVIYKTGSASLFLLFFFLLVNFPFMINFRPFVSGIGVLCAPKFLLEKKLGPFLFETGKCQRSDLWMMGLLWGFFYYNAAGFLIFAVRPVLLSVKVSADKISGIFAKLSRFFKLRLALLTVLNPVDVFTLIIIFISTLLLIFPEFFYIKDIYPAHYRANTMFKLGYQAFMMLSLVSGYTVFRIRSDLASNRKTPLFIAYNALYILLFTLVAIYPYYAINSYYGKLNVYRGLDGISWMNDQFPDDYQGVLWLRQNVSCPEGAFKDCDNQPVIAEAVGESYTDYSRVSAYTGLPTIVGWPVHEWLWRGSYDEAGKRIPEVQTLYETENIEDAQAVINKYNVRYIFVGQLEAEKYPNLNSDKFSSLADVVFEQGQTKIFRVKANL